jgi:hypothetical protein
LARLERLDAGIAARLISRVAALAADLRCGSSNCLSMSIRPSVGSTNEPWRAAFTMRDIQSSVAAFCAVREALASLLEKLSEKEWSREVAGAPCGPL